MGLGGSSGSWVYRCLLVKHICGLLVGKINLTCCQVYLYFFGSCVNLFYELLCGYDYCLVVLLSLGKICNVVIV